MQQVRKVISEHLVQMVHLARKVTQDLQARQERQVQRERRERRERREQRERLAQPVRRFGMEQGHLRVLVRQGLRPAIITLILLEECYTDLMMVRHGALQAWPWEQLAQPEPQVPERLALLVWLAQPVHKVYQAHKA